MIEVAEATQAFADTAGETLDGPFTLDTPVWQCEYAPHDPHGVTSRRTFIGNVAVAEDLAPLGSSALLDIRVALKGIHDQCLGNALVKVRIRGNFGITLFATQADAEGFFFSRPEAKLRGLHMSLPVERKVLQTLAGDGPYSLHVILEDQEGRILDRASGELYVSIC